jgi:uncharacterized protein (TIGR03435 family)
LSRLVPCGSQGHCFVVRISMTLACIASSALAASGQTAANAPAFEVASVKLVIPAALGGLDTATLPLHVVEQMGFRGGPGTTNPNRIDYSGVTLKMLLARAYNLRTDQISGPGWLDTQKYEIVAKLPPGTDVEGLRFMLQGLLTERFQITLHRENKTMAVYSLVVAKNGPKLRPAEKLEEYENDDERAAAMRAKATNLLVAQMQTRERGHRTFHLASATTAKFAKMLSSNLDHPVKDMTQLEGLYAFSLDWIPDLTMAGAGSAGAGNDNARGPNIFTAVQEQLGLKLEPAKEQLEVLVIDKAEKTPTSN